MRIRNGKGLCINGCEVCLRHEVTIGEECHSAERGSKWTDKNGLVVFDPRIHGE